MLNYKNHITPDGNIVIRYDSTLPIFDAAVSIDSCVSWIRDTFSSTGAKIAVVGISGGKDSSVVAALCAKALGNENVIGVKMPNGAQHDIDCANLLIEHLGIKSLEYDISPIVKAFEQQAADICIATPGWALPSDNNVPEEMWDVPDENKMLCEKAMEADDSGIYEDGYKLPRQAALNIAPRIRMATLYMIAQSLASSARVANTCNLSEDWVGYSTRWGDSVGDFCPLARYTASEVCAMGYVLGLPDVLIDKVPEDGLSGMSDEDNFGFTYEELDLYIRLGEHAPVKENVCKKIDEMHRRGEFKLHMPPSCPSGLRVLA